MSSRSPSTSFLRVALVLTLAASGVVLLPLTSTVDLGCPAGYKLVSRAELAEEFAFGPASRGEGEEGEEGEGREEAEDLVCLFAKHPEPFAELEGLRAERSAMITAPFASVKGGAYRAALQQRSQMIASGASVPGDDAVWQPYGGGPLFADDPRYDSVNGLGLVDLMGRVDSLAHDPATGRLFSLIGTGGVWMSDDLGQTWTSIGEGLPSQINGALAWTPAGGGTLVVVSGEHLMGGNTYTGIGAFWSDDLGLTWHRSTGVPDGALGFQVAVDPTNPSEVYVATSKGLFRSTDVGHSFVNVNLPTGECAGNTGNGKCLLANFVTDVVVQAPDDFGNAGGDVVAAVGYRAGDRPYPQDPDTLEGPYNGLYKSSTGAPGSFGKLEAPGFAPQERIGRVELGSTTGPDQNHDYLYAIVQDAVRFKGGPPFIDAPEGTPSAPSNTVFNGIYVSDDFGESWIQMADEVEVAQNPLTGSALAGTGSALFFAPGVQAWYNEWILPDPTRQDAEGVPTRLTFGLEEVWQNRHTDQPQNTAFQDPRGDFKVIGKYFAEDACLLLNTGQPACPSDDQIINPETTTHPDQHDAIYVPDGRGGVTLVVGHDGGTNVQHVAQGAEFSNHRWGDGDNDGYNTLLPYHAEMAKDGVVWFGLQDNGSGKIVPEEGFRQFMTFGGDGFFVAVDPDNSDVAYSETTFADMRVTTDGGQTWQDIPPPVSNSKFSNPFVMDPLDAGHLLTAGRQVVERLGGPDGEWVEVFDLGVNDRTGHTNSMSAVDVYGDNAYVGFCGGCDIINGQVFANGLATNVGGGAPPEAGTPSGWHFAEAAGLPNRYITSIAIDPGDPETVYVTLGGYANRQWRPPGSYGDTNPNIGNGHVFKSTNAGETFTNISRGLPDAPAFWVETVGNQLVVGTQVGVFLSKDRSGSRWAPLDNGLPVVPISTLEIAPQDPTLIVAATYGRGVYTYDLPGGGGKCPGLEDMPGNHIVGTGGPDVLTGTDGRDVICGLGGADRLEGRGDNDLLVGGDGADELLGGTGSDILRGGDGRDNLLGGDGNDELYGQAGNDQLTGGPGADLLAGGPGQDVCNGTGEDQFQGCESKP